MDTKNFVIAYNAIRAVQGSDTPTTEQDATELVNQLSEAIGPLIDWSSDFQTAVEELQRRVEEMLDADVDELAECHGELAGAAEDIVEALVDLGVSTDTVSQLGEVRS